MERPHTIHVPVMPREVIELLAPAPGQTMLDATAGGGGHTLLLAERVGGTGRVLAVDRDPSAIERIREAADRPNVVPICASYDELDELAVIPPEGLDGVLLDLGLSTDQLRDDARGFSYQSRGPLDMRFDPTRGQPAWQLLAELSQEELANLIYEYGEERLSRRIARRIVEARRRTPLRTADQLAEVVRSCVPRSRGHRIDPATRTFQALRIAVNQELDRLERVLQRLPQWLKPGGRVVVIAFHSLEDRLVKRAFVDRDVWERITKKPLRPSREEVAGNPKSRSAKLRAAILRPVAQQAR